MRTINLPMWALLILVLAASFAGPAPAWGQDDEATMQEYAQREAASAELEDFEGGAHGLVIALAVIAAVVILVAILVPW